MIDQSKLAEKYNCCSSVRVVNGLWQRGICRRGFSLIEVLIVVTILSLLITGGVRDYYIHLAKARDATRKSDLNRIKVAFTEYLGDYGCFPAATILSRCEGDELAPYLDRIPCDPSTGEPYYLDTDTSSSCPRRYRVLATLEMDTDPVIEILHCAGPAGCGGEGLENYNYGVADGVPVGNVDYLGQGDGGTATTPTPEPTGTPAFTPTPTLSSGPTPTPTPTPILPTPTATLVPTATPVPPPSVTPTPTPAYHYCCPQFGDQCNSYTPGVGTCDGTPYVELSTCQSEDNGCI